MIAERLENRDELQRRAKLRLCRIERRRRDPRFRRVLGRFLAEGLLTSNDEVPLHREVLTVDHVLWAGEIEPRFVELLPALIVKCPSLFDTVEDLPADLAAVVRRLRRNLEPDPFRGIAGNRLLAWLPRVGRRNKVPARLKSFRFRPDDLEMLQALSRRFGITETEVLRRGMRALLAESSG